MAYLKNKVFAPGSAINPSKVSTTDYGPYTELGLNGAGEVSLFAKTGHMLVSHTPGSTDPYLVDLLAIAAADDKVIPYVNKFIKDWTRVETYWRTSELRVVPPTGAPKVRAAKVAAPPVPVTQPAVEAVAPEPEPVIAPVIADLAAQAKATPPVVVPGAGKPEKVRRIKVEGQDWVVLPGDITIEARHYRTLVDAWEARQAGDLAMPVLTGPSGTAKTFTVRAFAKSLGVPLITVEGVSVVEASDWFGAQVQDELTGRWAFRLNEFGQAMVDGTNCIVLLDEGNRAATSAALNAMLTLADGQGKVNIPGYGNLRLPQGMMLMLTANLGAEYTGTVEIDAAVRQRFGAHGVALTYPTAKVETGIIEALTGLDGVDKGLAAQLVAMANQQRAVKDDMNQFPSGTGFSPRMLIDAAKRFVRETKRQSGVDIREVLTGLFDAQFDAEDRKALDLIFGQHFPEAANATLDVDTNKVNEA